MEITNTPRLIALLNILLLSVIRRGDSYNFRLEPDNFTGKGYMGDFGDFDNSGRLNYATYLYSPEKGKTTIYIYSDPSASSNGGVKDGKLEATDGKVGILGVDNSVAEEWDSKLEGATKFDGRNRAFEVKGECDGLTSTDLDSNGMLDILLVMKSDQGTRDQLYYLLIFFQNEQGHFINAWDSRTPLDVLFNMLDPVKELSDSTPKKTNTPSDPVVSDRDPMRSAHLGIMELKPRTLPIGKYEVTTIHPLVADFDGNGYPDILVQTSAYKLFFWVNYGKVFLPFGVDSVPTFSFTGKIGGVIPNPHSCSFVDMDGDCRPDIVLTVEDTLGPHIEIWLAGLSEEKINYRLWNNTILLPPHYGLITFHDINSDGTNDVVIPFCDSVDQEGFCLRKRKEGSLSGTGGPKLAIVYNKQIPFCPQMIRSGEEKCRHPNNLCIESHMTFTPYRDRVVGLGEGYQFIYPLRSVGRSLFKKNQVKAFPTQLPRVSACDFNNSSMIDLIVPLSVINPHDGKIKYVVMVVKNVEKNTEFIIVEMKEPELVLTQATTADIMDRRMLNLLVFTNSGDTLNCFYYSLYRENVDLFMKVMTKYKNIDESKYPDSYFLSGSNNNGLTYKLTVIDIHGIKNARTATLRPQTAYTPLYTPFTYIGLGKTNNYVEELYLGVSSANKNYTHMWISIIPSCTVITLPIPLKNPAQWILKLSIIPGKKLFTILLSTSISLIVIGIVILIFDLREKREDYVRAKGFRQKFIIN